DRDNEVDAAEIGQCAHTVVKQIRDRLAVDPALRIAAYEVLGVVDDHHRSILAADDPQNVLEVLTGACWAVAEPGRFVGLGELRRVGDDFRIEGPLMRDLRSGRGPLISGGVSESVRVHAGEAMALPS